MVDLIHNSIPLHYVHMHSALCLIPRLPDVSSQHNVTVSGSAWCDSSAGFTIPLQWRKYKVWNKVTISFIKRAISQLSSSG